MSHHGIDGDDARQSEIMRRIFETERAADECKGEQHDALHAALRKTVGEFPDGRLNQDDEGAIPMEVGHHSGKVIVRFPKAVTWVGLTGDGAMELAQCLIEHAKAAGITKPATITL